MDFVCIYLNFICVIGIYIKRKTNSFLFGPPTSFLGPTSFPSARSPPLPTVSPPSGPHRPAPSSAAVRASPLCVSGRQVGPHRSLCFLPFAQRPPCVTVRVDPTRQASSPSVLFCCAPCGHLHNRRTPNPRALRIARAVGFLSNPSIAADLLMYPQPPRSSLPHPIRLRTEPSAAARAPLAAGVISPSQRSSDPDLRLNTTTSPCWDCPRRLWAPLSPASRPPRLRRSSLPSAAARRHLHSRHHGEAHAGFPVASSSFGLVRAQLGHRVAEPVPADEAHLGHPPSCATGHPRPPSPSTE